MISEVKLIRQIQQQICLFSIINLIKLLNKIKKMIHTDILIIHCSLNLLFISSLIKSFNFLKLNKDNINNIIADFLDISLQIMSLI